jgi:hypothetical protein
MSDDDDTEYTVGYRKPPLASRFSKGTSGNLKGRPKSKKSLRASVQEVLTDPISIREGEKMRTITKIEAVFLKQLQMAITKGNVSSARYVANVATQFGLFDKIEPEPQYDYSEITDDELEIWVKSKRENPSRDGMSTQAASENILEHPFSLQKRLAFQFERSVSVSDL